MYLDHLESRVPKSNYDLCWKWRAIRDGKRYYLAISFDVCNDNTNECKNIINNVFLQSSEPINRFDWPDIDFSPNEANDEERIEGEYDDDSDLRLLDHCTKNNPYIRWERPFPERNGAGCNLFSQLAPIATVLLFYYQSKTGLHKIIAQKYYKWKINKLYKIILRDHVSSGSLIKPKPAPPKRHNVKTGKGEYEFIHINEKEQKRKIIISSDGKDVKKTKFRKYF